MRNDIKLKKAFISCLYSATLSQLNKTSRDAYLRNSNHHFRWCSENNLINNKIRNFAYIGGEKFEGTMDNYDTMLSYIISIRDTYHIDLTTLELRV
jgi:hypothetical protein